jgi:CheY-like chemotaxis protein
LEHTAADTERTPTVLVVEDEALIRFDIAHQLETAGFTVLQASNADHAIAILESRHDIRLVFTDIQMPGSMDGLRLAACVRDRWPPIQLIVTSGQRRVAKDEMPTGSRFIEKPYQSHQIIQTIAELVRGLRSSP